MHTTLIPEMSVSLWGGVSNASAHVGNVGERVERGRNMNPLLNAIGAGVTGVATVRAVGEKDRMGGGGGVPMAGAMTPMPVMGGFDAFADANLFTMKSLDAYVFFFPFPLSAF